MLDLKECFRLSPEALLNENGKPKRLDARNSIVINGRIIYITKSDNEGKASLFYVAFDYKTRVQLGFNSDKDFLIEYLKKQDLKVLNELEV